MNFSSIYLNLYKEISLLQPIDLTSLIEERLDNVLYNYIEQLNKNYESLKASDAMDVMKGVIKLGDNIN